MIRFYVDTLNFQIVDQIDDVGLSGWDTITRENFELMLASPSYIPAGWARKDEFKVVSGYSGPAA